MQKNEIYAIGVFTPLATGNNVRTEAPAGLPGGKNIQIGSNDLSGSAAAIELVPAINPDKVVAGYKIASQAEVVKISVIGKPGGTLASPVKETIVADQRYKIEIRNDFEEAETGKKGPGIYTYTAPSVLSGNAATDRLNVYTKLAAKINAHAHNHVEAKLLFSVAFTGGTGTVMPTIGETFTQATSGATFKVAGVLISGGSIDGDDAAGIIYGYDLTGTWSASSLASTGGTSSVEVTTAAALTEGEGLVIVDDAGYFPNRPNPREGATQVILSEGWDVNVVDSADLNTADKDSTGYYYGRAALYSRGQGTEMLSKYPVFTPGHENVVSGEALLGRQTGAFVAGATYTEYVLVVRNYTGPADAGHGGATPKDVQFVLYANETNATYLAAFESAIETAFGITIA